jgi:hypothetical protein
MTTYEDDDIFGEECYGVYEEHGIVKDNSVNKVKTKGVGKTNMRSRKNGNSEETQESEAIKVKLSKEEIFGAKMAEKKRKKEEAIAISKAAVEKREKEAAALKLIEDAKSGKLKNQADESEKDNAEEDDDWETKSF